MAKQEQLKIQDHQKRVVNKIFEKDRHGLIVYHGLGSGKTITSILPSMVGGVKTTAVTPASLQENYKKEIKKVHANPNNFNVESYDKFVSSKNTTPNDKTDLLVLDEAHKIKNSTSQRAQGVQSKAKQFKKVLLLTGTPIQNKPYEISTLINTAAGEKRLPVTEKEFNKQYVETKTETPGFFKRLFFGAKPHTVTNAKNLQDFRSKTKGLVDYYEPDESKLKDFPKTEYHDTKVDMTKSQQNLYKYYESQLPRSLKYKIKNSLNPSNKEVAKLNSFLSATRQISNSTGRFMHDTADSQASPKVKTIANRILKSNSPSVVYSNYLDSGINSLATELKKDNINYGLFTGKLSKDEKNDLVKKYNKGKLKALLVSSSGGEGLDLKNTGSVHIMEPHWNEPKVDQVIGRAVRYKSHDKLPPSDRVVKIYKYVSDMPDKVTVDEYLTDMGKKKKELNNQFLNVLKHNE